MKKYYYLVALVMLFTACAKDDSSPPVSGEVSGEVTTIEQNSAVISGTIPANAKSCGVCWDTVSDPTVASSHLAAEPQNGKFTTTITGLLPNRQYYAKVYAVDSKDKYLYSASLSLKTKQQLVNTITASGVGLHEATLNGYVSAIGGTYWFEWGETATYGQKTPEQAVTGKDLHALINGLDWHKAYYYRLAVKVNGQMLYGGNGGFTTLGNKPSVGNVNIDNDNLDKMIVKAMVNPNLISTSVVIEWGETNSYNHATTFQTVDGGKAVQVLFDIPVPERALEYHFRVKTENALGVVYTEDTVSISLALIDQYGNKFHACKIGTQYWLTANWKTLSYNNGDLIPNVTDPISWGEQTTGALCFYDNDQANYEVYGPLYNWYTIADSRGICPPGWHVPSYYEWYQLYNFLGQGTGGLKEAGLEHWYPVNAYGTNATGFTALPGGFRAQTTADPTPQEKGEFGGIHEYGTFWTTTETPNMTAVDIYMEGSNGGLWLYGSGYKYYGESIRLIKN